MADTDSGVAANDDAVQTRKFEAHTLQGLITVDAENEEQARRLVKDGGRVVISIQEVSGDPEPETADGFHTVSDSRVGADELVGREAERDEPVDVTDFHPVEGSDDGPTPTPIGVAGETIVRDDRGDVQYRTDPVTGQETDDVRTIGDVSIPVSPPGTTSDVEPPPAGTLPNVTTPRGNG